MTEVQYWDEVRGALQRETQRAIDAAQVRLLESDDGCPHLSPSSCTCSERPAGSDDCADVGYERAHAPGEL